MKKFEVTWYAGGIYHLFITNANSKEEAIENFYNISSDRAFVVKCEEIK